MSHLNGHGPSAKKGRIVRVRMTTFVTYDSAECVPGDGLNVVIGPNGSGKSTLLSAIVLGLGGKPSIIGRSPHIADYIKSGCQEAKVEVELFNPEGRNTVITRTIFRDGKSAWLINSRTSTLKDVENLTKMFNIQIDNLCQVLPQDRVQDFAKLNKQELLESTLKAVGKDGMSEVHTALKNMQKQQDSLERQLVEERQKRDQEQSHVDRLRSEVEKVERRKLMMDEVKACQTKLEIKKYEEKHLELTQSKEALKKAQNAVDAGERNLAPFEQEIKNAESELIKLKKKNSLSDAAVQSMLQAVVGKRQAAEDLKEKIIELENIKNSKVKQSERQLADADQLKLAISCLRNDLEALKNIPESEQEAKVTALNDQLLGLSREHNAAGHQVQQADHALNEKKQELEDIRRQQMLLGNLKEKRFQVLRNCDEHAYQAAVWVEQNRNRFQQRVYLPLIIELNVTDQKFASHVENAIGFNDMKAFICESKADFKILVDELRKGKGMKLNIVHEDAAAEIYRPKIPIEQLKQHCPGFSGYLIDYVSGPKTVMDMLCRQKQFHLIPVGDSTVDTDKVPREIRSYYTGNMRRIISSSRYSREIIRVNDQISDARFLINPIDDNAVAKLDQRANKLTQTIQQLASVQSEQRKKLATLDANRKSLREELKQLQQLQRNIQNKSFQLSQKERELHSFERRRIVLETVEAEFLAKVKDLILKLVQAQEPLYQGMKAADAAAVDHYMLDFEVQAARDVVVAKKELCKAEKKALLRSQRELEHFSNQVAELKTEAKGILDALRRETKKDVKQIIQEMTEVFNTLPESVEALESHIEDKLARAEMLGGGNDLEITREFHSHLNQLQMLEGSIKHKEAQVVKLSSDMSNRENEWKNDLHNLVSKISANFQKYFSIMKCGGEVKLVTGNSEHDYDNYGLRVRVTFRADEQLQDLDAHLQSGGERAVSTAIYMLSLQELTPVPFRLVDEINQGMDPINEKFVYELLLQSTSQPDTPQYFLLTPKLLQGLAYSENTTVLCIYNSSCAPSHGSWDVNRFIEIRRNCEE